MSHVDTIRRFNRFYTRKIGVLREGLLNSPFSLTEARVLYELAQRSSTASELCRELDLDTGYLSRILSKFEKNKLIKRSPNKLDARQSTISLTPRGRAAFEPLNEKARNDVLDLIAELPEEKKQELIGAMKTIEDIFERRGFEYQPAESPGGTSRIAEADESYEVGKKPSFVLREHRSGDMGWIVYRHAVLYAKEYGWTYQMESLVADIVAQFLRNFDSAKERCWLADTASGTVGSVFVVKQSDDVAQLRLLLVEPSARGMGVGKALVEECIEFARNAGYKTLMLWTQANLLAARKIYEGAGFKLVKTEMHEHFGVPEMGEQWELNFKD